VIRDAREAKYARFKGRCLLNLSGSKSFSSGDCLLFLKLVKIIKEQEEVHPERI